MTTVVTSRAMRNLVARFSHRRARVAAIGALVAASTTLLAVPGSASASNDVTCVPLVRVDKTVPFTEHQVNLKFYCDQPITSYSVVSNLEIDSFQPESQVTEPSTGAALAKQGFDCAGPIPGAGFSCDPSSGSIGAAGGKYVTDTLTTDTSPCTDTANFWLIVSDATGNTAGPFESSKPRSCPKPPKAKKKTRGRSAHRRR
jgi:hypothetical protein